LPGREGDPGETSHLLWRREAKGCVSTLWRAIISHPQPSGVTPFVARDNINKVVCYCMWQLPFCAVALLRVCVSWTWSYTTRALPLRGRLCCLLLSSQKTGLRCVVFC
jgi:hypothetical protein